MSSGQVNIDNWHKQVNTRALLNGVQPRRWGMRVTVTNDSTPANNTDWILVYNWVNTNIQDNDNWATLADYLGSIGAAGAPLDLVQVITTGDGAVIELPFENTKQRMFYGDGPFDSVKEIQLQDFANALVFQFSFEVSGLAGELAFTSDFTMQNSDTRWNDATKVWTPTEIGSYELSATWDGTNYWKLKISDPFI